MDDVAAPRHEAGRRTVQALSFAVFVQWVGAGAIVPLLPVYVRQQGGSDALIGVVMAAYFGAAVVLQYPAGRVADRAGRLPVLLGGLVVYAVGTLLFLLPVPAAADAAFRGLQGAGAGAAQVAALAAVAGAASPGTRGRAFGRIYAAQIGGTAIGPLAGSVAGVGAMRTLFFAAGVAALVACVPVARRARADPVPFAGRGSAPPPRARRGAGDQLVVRRAIAGALVAAAAVGLTTGLYESCWTLLLVRHGATAWEVGLSWTLFAVPFVIVTRPGGWMADHLDRRWLVAGAMVWSAGFCAGYPFLPGVVLLLILGAGDAVGFAVALPSTQSLLTGNSRSSDLGSAQGMYAASQTAATAVAAAATGALFGVAAWLPFVSTAACCLLLVAGMAVLWIPVPGRARFDVAAVGEGPVPGSGRADRE